MLDFGWLCLLALGKPLKPPDTLGLPHQAHGTLLRLWYPKLNVTRDLREKQSSKGQTSRGDSRELSWLYGGAGRYKLVGLTFYPALIGQGGKGVGWAVKQWERWGRGEVGKNSLRGNYVE
ncbi:hypothetical protein RRG08_053150 [Elysia crispata]|uniref:Uncharacterized protein n=1 Tax=Elysia crispata TaxID=231223 RepID=A0AAE1A8F3_9GAST|nr:hypothetical protein RRG08_053150 [Elysia crispata]